MIGTGRNIAAMCKAHGMTMTQMADRIGVTPVAVSKWKTGRNMPTIDNFIAMAGIFGVPDQNNITGLNRKRKK